MNVMILCDVVDNFGDIGFVYRLARSLSALRPDFRLFLVVSSLPSFSAIDPRVRKDEFCQMTEGFCVVDWNAGPECEAFFSRPGNEIECVLQCFQCARPAWLDGMLFCRERRRAVLVLNVEYLTAEPWADDFHKLKSGTRSALVKKYNFMPGFTSRTGALILGRPFMDFLSSRTLAASALPAGLAERLFPPEAFSVLVFSYPQDFTFLVRALSRFQSEMRAAEPGFSVVAAVAAGSSAEPFLCAVREAGSPFTAVLLPFLEQNAWDALITLTDFNFVRGEDSFSRASLSGVPFVWHAYEQEGGFQLVKVDAFLARLRPFLPSGIFSSMRDFSFLYNVRPEDCLSPEADSVVSSVREWLSPGVIEKKKESLLLELLRSSRNMRHYMEDFSRSLLKNGDFAANLADFISEKWAELSSE